jgi:hypothetical protein
MKSKIIAQITEPTKIEAAKKFLRANERMRRDFAAMEASYRKQIDDYAKAYNKEAREYFRTCVGDLLADPDDEFLKPEYYLDFQYADYGAVFLKRNIPEDSSESGDAEEIPGESSDDIERKIIVN